MPTEDVLSNLKITRMYLKILLLVVNGNSDGSSNCNWHPTLQSDIVNISGICVIMRMVFASNVSAENTWFL